MCQVEHWVADRCVKLYRRRCMFCVPLVEYVESRSALEEIVWTKVNVVESGGREEGRKVGREGRGEGGKVENRPMGVGG